MTDPYWERVVAHSVAEIKAGRTPNPDMLCNSRWGRTARCGGMQTGACRCGSCLANLITHNVAL
jgi:hypothetical protein